MAKHQTSTKCPKCQEIIYKHLLNPILRQWFEDLQEQLPDLHIAYTYRDKDEQNKFFREGKSKAKFGQSPHNYLPALAIDVFFLVNGKYSLDVARLANIADSAPPGITWGGKWKFKDCPHFEVTNWKTLADNYPTGNKPDESA
jgi:peptidoglycan L-alanyl-D-glutamate endopeptidase CwlK